MRSKGFTIFEMMVVVSILGFLMVIAIPNYVAAKNTAILSLCQSNQKMIFTAATMFQVKEVDSLEDMENIDRLRALTERGYLKGDQWSECPSEKNGDKDDYIIIFQNGIVSDVQCAVHPDEHVWP